MNNNVFPDHDIISYSLFSQYEEYWSKLRHPYVAGIELTPLCNLHCVHCYLQETNDMDIFTFDKVKIVIDKLFESGILILYFTGGEIMTHPDFIEIYTYAKKRGFIIELLTNLTCLTKEILDVLIEYPPANISITVYGDDERTYEMVTKNKKAYCIVKDNIKLLKHNNLHFDIKFMALKENYKDLLNVKMLAKKYCANFNYRCELFPTLKGNNTILKHMLSTTEIIEIEASNEETIKLLSNKALHNKNNHKAKKEKKVFLCDIATTLCFIDYQGYINPCYQTRLKKYNILNCDFMEIWRLLICEFSEAETEEEYKCSDCDYREFCSPCPATNYLASGSYIIPPKYKCDLVKARFKEFTKQKYNIYIESE